MKGKSEFPPDVAGIGDVLSHLSKWLSWCSQSQSQSLHNHELKSFTKSYGCEFKADQIKNFLLEQLGPLRIHDCEVSQPYFAML